MIEVSENEFFVFLGQFEQLFLQKIRFSSPLRWNYFTDIDKTNLVAYKYDSYGDCPPTFHIQRELV